MAPFAVGGLDGGRVADGGARLADMEGEGDERGAVMLLVWMPGGTGRLILVEAGAAGAATAVGAIDDEPAAAGGAATGYYSMNRAHHVAPEPRLLL